MMGNILSQHNSQSPSAHRRPFLRTFSFSRISRSRSNSRTERDFSEPKKKKKRKIKHIDINNNNDKSLRFQSLNTGLLELKPFEQQDRRSEIIRLISQSLVDLGLTDTATLLEKETGIKIEEENISYFRNLLIKGKWNLAIDSLKNFNLNHKS